MSALNRRDFLLGTAASAAVFATPVLIPACAGNNAVIHAKNGDTLSRVSPSLATGYFASSFGITKDTIRKCLTESLKGGGSYSDIYFQHSILDYLAFEDGQVINAYARVALGAGVRVLNGDQTGYAYTEDISLKSLIAAAGTASSIAKSGKGSIPGQFKTVKTPDLYEKKQVWINVSPEKKIALLQNLGDQIGAMDKRIKKTSIFTVNEDNACLVATSEGKIAEDIRPMTKIYLTCTAVQKDKKESYTYRLAGREGMEFYSASKLDQIKKESVKRTVALFEASPPPPGEMPVVLAPATSGILLHEAIGHGIEADFNRKKTSIFCSMMNKKVAEDFVTIVDTALEPKSRGAISVDDEAVPGKRTVMVQNGKLVSYLHDRISANYYKVEPTGSGRRESFRYPPMPRMRVTTMENGPHDPEEIIKSVKKGIYAVDFTNGQVAIGAGDYSFYVKTGFLIEDGKLTRPIKDCNIIGNGPDTLSKMTMVGNDKKIDMGSWTCGKNGQSVPVSLGLPTVKVSKINVGGVKS